MDKERVHTLEQTSATFQIRGVVTGMKREKAYQSGTTKSGGNWNSIDIGLNINSNKTVYMKLRGFPRSEVFYYKAAEKKGEKGTTKKVAWKDRKKSPGDGFRLIGVNISTSKGDDGKNVNEMFTEYDAVEYLHDNLKDGTSLFVKGNMEFSSYTNKNGEVRRSVDLVPTQISFTKDDINFDADDFAEMAEFENTIVFSSIEKEMDENDKPTERFILSGYNIGYATIEPTSFIVDKAHAKLAGNLRKAMKPAYAIKTYGRIEVINDISAVETDDDGWGEASPMERLNSPTKREYVVYKAVPDTIDKETYSEDKIAAAIRAIKNAKEAEQKFVVNDDTSSDADWGDGDFGDSNNDDETPW